MAVVRHARKPQRGGGCRTLAPLHLWYTCPATFGQGWRHLMPALPLITRDDEVELIPAEPLRIRLCCPPVRAHAEALYHADRCLVWRVGTGTDFAETRVPKGIIDGNLGHLSGKSLMPMRRPHGVEQFQYWRVVEVAESRDADEQMRSVCTRRPEPKIPSTHARDTATPSVK